MQQHNRMLTLLGLVRQYPQNKTKFKKAPLKHAICAPAFYETLVSASAVYPVPSQYDADELLEFICDQFISRMEGVLVAQRGKLISPDYKLTNMKNDIGKILCGRGTYRSKLLPPYIPGILSSTIISEQWLNFVNEVHHSASRQKPQTTQAKRWASIPR